MKQTKTVKLLKLAKIVPKDPKSGTTCVVAGWGKTNNIGKMSDVLMSVTVTVIDRTECKNYYNRSHVITSGMICAGSDGKNRADTCQVRLLWITRLHITTQTA